MHAVKSYSALVQARTIHYVASPDIAAGSGVLFTSSVA